MTALLWWLALSPWGLFALGWIALLPFFYSLRGLSARGRWKQGLRSGWLSYALISWWIIPTVAHASPLIGIPGGAGALLGLLSVVCIGLIHGTLAGLVAIAWEPEVRLFRRCAWLLPLFVAALWGVFDAARCETSLAYGWGALAFTQWPDLPLLQTTSWLGQHGLSAVCVWFSASLALWLREGQRPHGSVHWQLPVGVLACLHVVGLYQLVSSREPHSRADALHVLVVQTSASTARVGEAPLETPLEQACRMTRSGVQGEKFDLVVWPETTVDAGRLPPRASKLLNNNGPRTRQTLEMDRATGLSRELGVPILFGADGTDETVGPGLAGQRNAAVLADQTGAIQWSGKTRLVPFGERAPFSEWFPFLSNLAPRPPIAAASAPTLLRLHRPNGGELAIGAIICFESCFPDPALYLRRSGARALFVLTNDQWFAGSEAPFEHRAMAAVRAVENGVPVVQSANGGEAAAVDPEGQFMVYGRYGVSGILDVWLPLRT